MNKLMFAFALLTPFSASATIETVKSLAHATFICEQQTIQTNGLKAMVSNDNGDFQMSGNTTSNDQAISLFYVVEGHDYKFTDEGSAHWFAITYTKDSGWLSLTYVDSQRGIQVFPAKCERVE